LKNEKPKEKMPRYQIDISDEAEEDFEKIWYYLLDNDFDLGIIRKIRTGIDKRLSERPENNLKTRNGTYKILILRKNVVYYEIIGKTVRILRVFAGKMNKDI